MDREQKEQKKGFARHLRNHSKGRKQDSRRTYVKKADRKRRYLILGCGMALLSVLLAAALFFFSSIVDGTIEELVQRDSEQYGFKKCQNAGIRDRQ